MTSAWGDSFGVAWGDSWAISDSVPVVVEERNSGGYGVTVGLSKREIDERRRKQRIALGIAHPDSPEAEPIALPAIARIGQKTPIQLERLQEYEEAKKQAADSQKTAEVVRELLDGYEAFARERRRRASILLLLSQ
jgi:hypothetical protein